MNVLSYYVNHIDCNLCWFDKKWRFSSIYGCPESQNKKVTWEFFRRFASNDGFPWLIGCDINECMWKKEKRGGANGLFHSMEMFR